MSDPLAAFYAEIRAIEDGWFAEHFGTPDSPVEQCEPGRDSLWGRNLPLLREVEARHGVRRNDPRVHSISAYQAESSRIVEEDERASEARERKIREDPDADPPYYPSLYRYRVSHIDLEARSFPGFKGREPETIDTRAKIWFSIVSELRIHELLNLHYISMNVVPDHLKRAITDTYSLLHRRKVSWAPAPPYPNFTTQEAIDELTRLANRLESEDAEWVAQTVPQVIRDNSKVPPDLPMKQGQSLKSVVSQPAIDKPDPPRLTVEDRAIELVLRKSTLGESCTVTSIARELGVNRQYLYDLTKFKAIIEASKQSRAPRRGRKDRETGEVTTEDE